MITSINYMSQGRRARLERSLRCILLKLTLTKI